MIIFSPKSAFFDRKNLLLICASAGLALVTINAGTLVAIKVNQYNQLKHAKAAQVTADKVPKEEKAIKKAETYLENTIGEVDTPQRLILDYLQRKFNLDSNLSVKGSSFTVPEDPAVYPAEINYAARIAYPDKVVKQPPKTKVTGTELTNIYSLSCDYMKQPANFWQTMEQNYTAGSYYLTHDALAFAFMRDNGCNIPDKYADLQDKVAKGMVSIANNPGSSADIRYESIAFLFMSGKRDMVDPRWIDAIVQEQLNDGGWSDKLGSKKFNDHATVLALWALLEYTHPNTPYEPLIHRQS